MAKRLHCEQCGDPILDFQKVVHIGCASGAIDKIDNSTQQRKAAIKCPECGCKWGNLNIDSHIKCIRCGHVWYQTAAIA